MKTLQITTVVAFVLVAWGCGGSEKEPFSLLNQAVRQVICEEGGPGPVWLDGRMPETRTRQEINAVMGSLVPQVARCGDDGGSNIRVEFEVNPDGTITSISSPGKYDGTSVGDCAARAVCEARFPPVTNPIGIKYPFPLGDDYLERRDEPDGKCLSTVVTVGADGTVDGETVLTESFIDRVIYAHMEELECCFAGSLGSGSTRKKRVYVEVGIDGSVVKNSHSGCLGQVFASMRFPPPSGDSPVAFLYELRITRVEGGDVRVSKEGKPFGWRP